MVDLTMTSGMTKEVGPRQDFGSRLLPSVLDEWARREPARLYAVIPCSEDSNEGFEEVTMFQMSQAIDSTAWWLKKTFEASEGIRCLAYIGASDLRYPIVQLATMKIGWTVSKFDCCAKFLLTSL